MPTNKYILVSLPSSIARSHHPDHALDQIVSTVSPEPVKRFPIPEFKIGTLDALVQQADDLAKLDANVEGAVHKVADILRAIVPGQEDVHKRVNDKSVSIYLNNFSWNKSKYRTDRSIGDILSLLQREVVSMDSDIKAAYSNYTTTRASLANIQRKTSGNLTTRSLVPLLSKDDFITDSEYLETLLIVVPKSMQKDWLKVYETLASMVVPRSSAKLAEDEEYTLWNVVVFKKYAAEFAAKARAARFSPREFKWSEDAQEVDEREAKQVEEQERKAYEAVLMLTRTGYGELVAAWTHVKALRVFVESVLRYGLPLDFVSAIIECKSGDKSAKKVKSALDERYGYLGGNAFGRDKKGKIKDDVGDVAAGVAGLHLGGEYTAYCYFEFQIV